TTRAPKRRHPQRTRGVWQSPLLMTPLHDRVCRLHSLQDFQTVIRTGQGGSIRLSPYLPRVLHRPERATLTASKQGTVAERLVQEVHSSLSERLFPDVFVFLAGDEDDWNGLPTTFQFLLKIESGHSRHRDIEDQTAGLIHVIRREKLLPR